MVSLPEVNTVVVPVAKPVLNLYMKRIETIRYKRFFSLSDILFFFFASVHLLSLVGIDFCRVFCYLYKYVLVYRSIKSKVDLHCPRGPKFSLEATILFLCTLKSVSELRHMNQSGIQCDSFIVNPQLSSKVLG